MTATLYIQLLGEFRLLVDSQPLDTLNKPRQQALLAYLLLHRHAPQSRQQIAFSFWPDSSESQAYTNLRKLFFQLRQALPEPDAFLVSDTLSLGWQQEAAYTFDVVALEQALDSLEKIEVPAPKTVERVVALYQGELLPTCYDDWLLSVRRSLHERVVNTLTQALNGLQAQHEYEVGLRTAEHLLRLDPLRETTYRHLMHLWALSGDRARALRIYHECVTMLEQELGVSPSTETQALYQQLLQGASQVTSASTLTLVQRHEHVPLVGRKQEWQILQQAWQQMTSHGPHMVTIWGEAGVGKTRLVEELLRWARLRSCTVAYARSYAAEGTLSYAPLTEWLRSEALRPALATLAPLWLSELARLLPELLTEQHGLLAPLPMTEGWQRRRFHEALARAILAAATPRVLVLDDLQWCDSETLAWLSYLLRFDVQTPLLIVGTVRTEAVDKQHPLCDLREQLQREGRWTELPLAPLNREETAVLARHLTGTDITEWHIRLYQETEGNPLFLVEMVRAGLVSEPEEIQSAQGRTLPPTVQAVIGARLKLLSDSARQLAQVAATIGRNFTVSLVAAASDMSEDMLMQGLDELWQRHILREQPEGYDFSHDKIREVVYAEIQPMRRQVLHRRVAQALEHTFALSLDEVSGLIASHYEHARQIRDALVYLQRAALVAQRINAYNEGIHLLRHALTLIEQDPKSKENDQLRLELLTQLAKMLAETKGTASPEVMEIYEQARKLNNPRSTIPTSFTLLQGIASYHRVHGDYTTALEFNQQLLDLAHDTQTLQDLVAAHFELGATYYMRGDLIQARSHLEQSAQLCAVPQPNARPLSLLAEVLWLLGYPDLAFQKCREALALVREHGTPFNMVAEMGTAIELRLLTGIQNAVNEDLEAFHKLVHQYGFTQFETWDRYLQGWALVNSTGLQMVIQMEKALEDFQVTGARARLSRFYGLIAQQYIELGEIEQGEARLAKAINNMEQHSERFWEAELHRLKGEILLTRGKSLHAEAWFQRALDTARVAQAKLLELRAAISLSRLWQQQGRQHQAATLLSETYGWYTEGFDNPDLLEAKTLLTELA